MNSNRFFFCVCVCALVLICAVGAQAQQSTAPEPDAPATAARPPAQAVPGPAVPHEIKFSAVLRDSSGKPLTGTFAVTFALYDQQEGGTPFWSETQNVDLDAAGHYSVLLGAASSAGVSPEFFSSSEGRWLGVRVLAPGEVEQPRVRWVSVPYALKAGDAETLGGLPASAFAPASSAAATSSSSSTPRPLLLASPGATSAATAPLTGAFAVTTDGGTANSIPLWSSGAPSTTLTDSILVQSSASTISVNGSFSLPAVGTATMSAGSNSQPLDFFASSFNSNPPPGAAVAQHFSWQAEPVNNNTTNPSGSLNLLFATGTGTPAETGLSISSGGLVTFAPGQTLPTVSGNETVTGNLSASQLISTLATGTAPLSVNSTTQVPNLNASLLGGLPAGAFAMVGASNTFTGLETFAAPPSGAGVGNGSLYINPPSTSGVQTLLGAAVGGTQEMLLDSGGNLSLSGALVMPTIKTPASGGLTILTSAGAVLAQLPSVGGSITQMTLTHMRAGGKSPTCAAASGFGTGASCAFRGPADDMAAEIVVTTGTSAAASGTVTLKFGAVYSNSVSCIANLSNGSAAWNPRATVMTAAPNSSVATFSWDNNGVPLTDSSHYNFSVICMGRF